MPRNKVIIKYPTLNDKGGDLSKQWYVEYFYRTPEQEKPIKRRIYEGLCTGSAESRYATAKTIIAKITKYLNNPNLLCCNNAAIEKVRADEYATNEEALRYKERESRLSIGTTSEAYISHLRGSIAQKTFETYKSKIKQFALWVTENNIYYLTIEQPSAAQFFRWLYENRNLSKLSIGKYKQILHSFYSWLIKNGYCTHNPIYDIPNYGTLVDRAPRPIAGDDRLRLKAAIENTDPYLWLACELQYYCALRPGQEIRLLKVGDIDLTSMCITVRSEVAKNRHKETVAINQTIADLITKMGIMNYSEGLYVFGTYNLPAKQPVGKNTLRNRFNRYREALGISRQVKFYSWKHTGAISAVENGISVWDLQHHMRHSSIVTTEEYIRQRTNHAKRAIGYIDDI